MRLNGQSTTYKEKYQGKELEVARFRKYNGSKLSNPGECSKFPDIVSMRLWQGTFFYYDLCSLSFYARTTTLICCEELVKMMVILVIVFFLLKVRMVIQVVDAIWFGEDNEKKIGGGLTQLKFKGSYSLCKCEETLKK